MDTQILSVAPTTESMAEQFVLDRQNGSSVVATVQKDSESPNWAAQADHLKQLGMASGRDVTGGTPNMNDPKVRANLYMQSHGIKELFDGLATLLLFHRPAEPRAFLAQHLAELQRAKQNQTHVPFFEEQDLEAMFAAFDVNDRGYITPQQYDQALRSLGIEQQTLRLPESLTQINQSLFTRSMTQELKNATASLM